MNKSLLLVVSLTLLSRLSLSAQAAVPPLLDGHWEGVIVATPAEMEVDVDIDFARDGKYVLQGRLAFPTQQPRTYELQKLVFRAAAVSFFVLDDNQVPSFFEGTVSQDGSEITGTMTEELKIYPFSLRRRAGTPTRETFLSPVLRVAEDGAELRQAFNEGAGHVRLLMILSPTEFPSRMALRLVQRYVLDQVADPDLEVYVVWEAVYGGDSEQASHEASGLVKDPRVRQFWSGSRFSGHSFQGIAGRNGKPAWDSYLVFAGDKRWTDTVPAPDQILLTPLVETEIQADRRMNGVTLANEINRMLSSRLESPGKTAVSRTRVRPADH